MDGVDIQSLNLRWLRGQIGLVRQQPVLFDTTIYDNIRYGRVGCSRDSIDGATPTTPNISGAALTQQIIASAKLANAHDFIMALPAGYQTLVGENSTQISGGQKQRIAIARALMRDPKILLLDEATSALDAASESLVQAALTTAAEHRTTIVIAHRLSTIRHADNIVVMSHGEAVEQGAHADLMARDGHYARLVRAQQLRSRHQHDNLDEDDESSVESAIVPSEEDETPLILGPEMQGERERIHEREGSNRSWGLGSTLALIIRMNSSERWYLVFGLACSIVAGLSLPACVTLLAHVATKLTNKLTCRSIGNPFCSRNRSRPYLCLLRNMTPSEAK